MKKEIKVLVEDGHLILSGEAQWQYQKATAPVVSAGGKARNGGRFETACAQRR